MTSTQGAGPTAGDPVVVVGAGPAGLTAAYELVKRGDRVVVAESDSVVGGISRTVERDGWRFDIGGHRFFTKVQADRGPLARDPARRGLLAAAPDEPHLLPGQVLRLPPQAGQRPAQPRASPKPSCAAPRTCGPGRSRPGDQTNYEGWLVARFGWRLYRTFFKTYTEKVWGVPVSEMPADWAAQRVKNLDLGKAVLQRAPAPGATRRRSPVSSRSSSTRSTGPG